MKDHEPVNEVYAMDARILNSTEVKLFKGLLYQFLLRDWSRAS